MNVVDLSGSWQVRQGNRPRSLAATVPGCIHLDLLNAGKIKDPFAPGAEARLEWIARETWHYEKTFTVPESLADMPVLRMRCEGLDTLAVLTLNGAEIGRADNMHRVWRYDLRGVLRAGENRLCVTFDPPLEHIERRQMERQLPDWHGTREPAGRAWL